MKFLIYSQFGELLDLGLALKAQEHEVLLCIPDPGYEKLGDGMIEKCKSWYEHLGQDYIWVVDSCDYGQFQEWLRERGESVVGGCKAGDELENNRQLNQRWFKEAGFYQPVSKNFKDIDSAIEFVQGFEGRLIMKQNGSAPKSINHMGKFEDGSDMLFHLEQMKKKWDTQVWGEIDFDLMEVVEGLEVAASAFFNGREYLHNAQGRAAGFLNFEEKKETDGGLGETVGEMGTTFVGVDDRNELFRSILINDVVIDRLAEIGFRGIFDINCIKTDKGIVALEPTCRFGIPATSYEFIEGLENPAEVLQAMADGKQVVPKVKMGIGMVMCVVAKPYPVEEDVATEATSNGEKLWPLRYGKPIKDFSAEQKKHIHFYNFTKTDDGYMVATKNGYLLVVSGTGTDIASTREALTDFIKNNLYISGMKYRTDIGKRVEESDIKFDVVADINPIVDIREKSGKKLIFGRKEPMFVNK